MGRMRGVGETAEDEGKKYATRGSDGDEISARAEPRSENSGEGGPISRLKEKEKKRMARRVEGGDGGIKKVGGIL